MKSLEDLPIEKTKKFLYSDYTLQRVERRMDEINCIDKLVTREKIKRRMRDTEIGMLVIKFCSRFYRKH